MSIKFGMFLINQQPGGGLSHLRTGGGVKMTIPKSKTKRDKEALENGWMALNEYIRKGFSHFFTQLNIEGTRGYQRSKFSGVSYFFGNVPLFGNLL